MELQSAAEDVAFVRSLAELKRTGCNLLVIGESAPHVHTIGCDRLLGQDDLSPRWRVFVRTDGSCQRDIEPCTATGSVRTRTIRHTPQVRSAVAQSGTPPAVHSEAPSVTPGPAVGNEQGRSRPPSAATIPLEVSSAIDEFESERGTFEPAELRVCIDSLGPLLAEYDLATVFRLTHLITARIDTVDGMGHFHLPLPLDHEVVRTVEPLFDGIIELRTNERRLEQRWHLWERGVTSEWLVLNPA